jgi:hypothetical protein
MSLIEIEAKVEVEVEVDGAARRASRRGREVPAGEDQGLVAFFVRGV